MPFTAREKHRRGSAPDELGRPMSVPGAPVYLHMTRDNPAQAGRREWLGLAVIALPCLLYSIDLTVLHLAVPALGADLQPTSA